MPIEFFSTTSRLNDFAHAVCASPASAAVKGIVTGAAADDDAGEFGVADFSGVAVVCALAGLKQNAKQTKPVNAGVMIEL